jgi:hypothetical protein
MSGYRTLSGVNVNRRSRSFQEQTAHVSTRKLHLLGLENDRIIHGTLLRLFTHNLRHGGIMGCKSDV